jgi:hypothetical protein
MLGHTENRRSKLDYGRVSDPVSPNGRSMQVMDASTASRVGSEVQRLNTQL